MTLLKYQWFAILISVLLISSCSDEVSKETFQVEPISAHSEPYLGAQKCKECHAEEFNQWATSDHYFSMQKATNEFVKGDFATTFVADEISYVFSKRDSNYSVEITQNGKTQKFEVAYTFGWHPLQQYLLKTENGKFQTLRASWDTEQNKWFHQYDGEIVEPHDWLSWSKGGQNWNTMCSSCHSTHVKKNYDPHKDVFNTTYKEINVACESCHGPGRDHLLAHKDGTKDPYANLKNLTSEEKTNNCGTCHARRTMLLDNGDPRANFLEAYFPQTLNNNFYEADGQIKEEDFVYGSFISSKMHRNHVTCTNCHNPHSNKLKAEGNQLCLQCHDQSYSQNTHTHHPQNSEGNQCINCHMDGKMYMGIDYRRDHSFRIPRPDQSIHFGTSNACNSCHTDQSAKWAATHVTQWFGYPRAYHFSDDLLPGSKGNGLSVSHLKNLLVNDSVPEIVKATAVDYLQSHSSEEATNLLIEALTSKDDLVRLKAYSGLIYFPKEYRQQYGMIGIQDPQRAIRMLAFRSVVDVDAAYLKPEIQEVWKNVHAEYLVYLKANADFPTGQIMLGEYYETIGQTNQAVEAYENALKMDSLLMDGYSNLAILYSTQNMLEKVDEVLKQGILHFPENGEFYYFMGLNHSAQGNSEAQLKYLKRAYTLSPQNEKYGYNYILTLYQNGKQKEANKVLTNALKNDPQNQRYLELKAYFDSE
ncbi:MAG: multiheme c-type cytochrome [Salibacteraceae bacterium]